MRSLSAVTFLSISNCGVNPYGYLRPNPLEEISLATPISRYLSISCSSVSNA